MSTSSILSKLKSIFEKPTHNATESAQASPSDDSQTENFETQLDNSTNTQPIIPNTDNAEKAIPTNIDSDILDEIRKELTHPENAQTRRELNEIRGAIKEAVDNYLKKLNDNPLPKITPSSISLNLTPPIKPKSFDELTPIVERIMENK